MHPNTYATVLPDDKGNGWKVAARTGDRINYRRLAVGPAERETARAQAAELYPDRTIWVAGDEGTPPWNQPATLEVAR